MTENKLKQPLQPLKPFYNTLAVQTGQLREDFAFYSLKEVFLTLLQLMLGFAFSVPSHCFYLCNRRKLLYQSINQSINQSISQSVSQSINQSISQSVSQSINQANDHFFIS